MFFKFAKALHLTKIAKNFLYFYFYNKLPVDSKES